MSRMRTAVLISGRGSNMVALADSAADPAFPAEIVLVLSDDPKAAGIDKAREAGLPVEIVDRAAHSNRAAFESALQRELHAADAEFVCLAGFMRVLSDAFVEAWFDRMLNIHPSLIPAFRGINTHQRALDAGVRLHGCTVHFVRADVDAGPIVIQAAVPVLPADTVTTLAERLLPVEHRVYPMALDLVASGRARVVGSKVVIDDMPDQTSASLIFPDMTGP
jgi:phosphoribosylglycinamide formyltransferase-1